MSDAGAALDAFLVAAGTTRAEVVAAVTARLGLGPADRLLAAGSVVEGLGSRKSDLDLLLLTSADAGTADQVALVVGRCVVEVRVVRPAALRALLDRFAAWRAGPWDVSREAGFGPQEHRLMHRLRHSLALHGDRPDGMPTVADLAADLPLRPSPLPAAERVWALHRAPEHPEPAAAHRHALAATTFARAVLAAIEHQLLTGRPLAPLPRPAAAGGEASPWLDLDVDYVLGDPILLGRLNEPGRPGPLPRRPPRRPPRPPHPPRPPRRGPHRRLRSSGPTEQQ